MRTIILAMHTVFKHPRWRMTAVGVIFIFLSFAVMISQYGALSYIVRSDTFTLAEKIKIVALSYGALNTNFLLSSQIGLAVVSALAGINVAMIAYLLNEKVHVARMVGKSLAGVFLSVLGIGCTVCGSVLLTSLFGISVTASLIVFLPFRGVEFFLLGSVLLMWSIRNVSKKIMAIPVCSL